MSGGQEKNFNTLGPKLRGNKAQQDYIDKQRQICIEVIDYNNLFFNKNVKPHVRSLIIQNICSSPPGGTASGSCASGFGVCCTLTGRCGGSTSVNNTYFAADGSEASPCSFKVCKASEDICQIR